MGRWVLCTDQNHQLSSETSNSYPVTRVRSSFGVKGCSGIHILVVSSFFLSPSVKLSTAAFPNSITTEVGFDDGTVLYKIHQTNGIKELRVNYQPQAVNTEVHYFLIQAAHENTENLRKTQWPTCCNVLAYTWYFHDAILYVAAVWC